MAFDQTFNKEKYYVKQKVTPQKFCLWFYLTNIFNSAISKFYIPNPTFSFCFVNKLQNILIYLLNQFSPLLVRAWIDVTAWLLVYLWNPSTSVSARGNPLLNCNNVTSTKFKFEREI